MRIATIVGARPQFVKAAAVSAALRTFASVDEQIIHTGQHYDENLSQLFFKELQIPEPTYNLEIGSLGHGAQIGRMLEALERVLIKTKPDGVIVYGDTNSTLAGALAAAKLCLPLAHIEAGLRSYNRAIPEETNRVLTDHCSDLLFAPTTTAVENLRKEGVPEDKLHFVGDVMYDVALKYGDKAEKSSDVLARAGLERSGYVLATIHRPSNTDNGTRLRIIMSALMQLSRELPVVLPLHPRTRKSLIREHLLEAVSAKLHVIEAVGYLDMVTLEKNACLIATDSGGVQKEAFFYHVSCVTLREETEWPELLELGCNRLAPPTTVFGMLSALRKGLEPLPPIDVNPYGDGRSASRIADILVQRFENKTVASEENQVLLQN